MDWSIAWKQVFGTAANIQDIDMVFALPSWSTLQPTGWQQSYDVYINPCSFPYQILPPPFSAEKNQHYLLLAG
jgi:hypothetical protein